MPVPRQPRPPVYHHFILLVWEECDAEGRHLVWRFSLQDSQKETRIGFKNLEELTVFLERWMKDPSAGDTNQKELTQ